MKKIYKTKQELIVGDAIGTFQLSDNVHHRLERWQHNDIFKATIIGRRITSIERYR